MKESKVILCTGGIGSGKSYVIRLFNAMGIPSYDCDAAAKDLYDRDMDLLSSVAQVAGEDVLDENGLNRAALAAKIFSDGSILARIESLVHPAVMRDFEKWKQAQSSQVVIIESAIMLEKPALRNVADYVVVVEASEELRIKRVMARDSASREAVLGRMSRQWNDDQRRQHSDFVINTDEGQQLVPQIVKIIETIKNGKDRS